MVIALVATVVVLPFWKVFARIGFPGWMGLAMVVPVLNLIVLYYVAFAKWPLSERDRQHDPSE